MKNTASDSQNPYPSGICIFSFGILFCLFAFLFGVASIARVQHLETIHCTELFGVNGTDTAAIRFTIHGGQVNYEITYKLLDSTDPATSLQIMGPWKVNQLTPIALTLCGGQHSCPKAEQKACDAHDEADGCRRMSGDVNKLDTTVPDVPVSPRAQLSGLISKIERESTLFYVRLITQASTQLMSASMGGMCQF
jgi:hypothetical protein